MRVAAAVLCGGRSTRMGTDKALLPVDGVPMAKRVSDTLVAAGCHPVLAVGGDSAGLIALGLDVVADGWPGEGPLGGVLTALRHLTEADAVAVLACDLPYVTVHTISRLVAALAASPSSLAAAAVTDRIQPLCVVWRPDAWEPLHLAFAQGERRLQAVLRQIGALEVSVNLQDLANMNAPGDLPTSL